MIIANHCLESEQLLDINIQLITSIGVIFSSLFFGDIYAFFFDAFVCCRRCFYQQKTHFEHTWSLPNIYICCGTNDSIQVWYLFHVFYLSGLIKLQKRDTPELPRICNQKVDQGHKNGIGCEKELKSEFYCIFISFNQAGLISRNYNYYTNIVPIHVDFMIIYICNN